MVIENLPWCESFKIENVILVGCIPGLKEPNGNINSFLKPLVDEILELWSGVQLHTDLMFWYTSIRCALICVASDLPANRKVCGFAGHAVQMGCSKCLKKFISGAFGEKLDYSEYNREIWQYWDHVSHLQQVASVQGAKTLTEQKTIQKKWGVRYSELLWLPFILLGTTV